MRIGGGGCARVQHAHPTRSSRSCTVPARLLRVTRDMAAEVRNAPCRAHSGRARQRWLGFPIRALNTRKEGGLKRTTTGGCAEKGFKHRARDAGEMADLRHYQTGRRFIEKHRPASASREAEARGSSHDPGVPRRPHFSRRSRWQSSDAETRRENESGCVDRRTDFERCAVRATCAITLPWRGLMLFRIAQ